MFRILITTVSLFSLLACQQGGPLDLTALAEKAKSGDVEACRKMVDLLGVEKNGISEKVYPLVIETGQPVVAPLLASVSSVNTEQRERVIAALGTLRVASAVQPISQVLADKSLKRRYIAAWALGEIGDPAGIPALLQALSDPEELVRQYATRSLIKFNRTAVDPLVRFLDGADTIAAGGAIRALGDIGDKQAIDALLPQVDGPNRTDVLLALGKLRDSRAESALIDALDDPDWKVRMNAAMALGPVGSRRSVPGLQTTLDDPVMVVREWSARSLSVITGKTVMYRDADGQMVEPYSVYH